MHNTMCNSQQRSSHVIRHRLWCRFNALEWHLQSGGWTNIFLCEVVFLHIWFWLLLATLFLHSNNGRALIGDEMGLGKTIQAIAAAVQTRLVVAANLYLFVWIFCWRCTTIVLLQRWLANVNNCSCVAKICLGWFLDIWLLRSDNNLYTTWDCTYKNW